MTKVIERKFRSKKFKVYGEAYPSKKLILIDPRQKSKSYMDTLIHESLHIAFPDMSENAVRKATKVLKDILWEQGYRKVNL